MKTKGFPVAEEFGPGRLKKATDSPCLSRYPGLSDVGEETFSCPIARLYLTTLATLSCTVAFREMTPDEMHEEMVRRSGEIESISAGGGKTQ